MSLRAVCRAEEMPAASTVFLWLSKHKSFSEQYARAQADRTAYWAEEIVEISDDDKADIQRSKLKVDTRKWLMSKMAPRKFGDRVAIGGDRSMDPIKIDMTALKGMTDQELEILERALGQVGASAGDQSGEAGEGGEPED